MNRYLNFENFVTALLVLVVVFAIGVVVYDLYGHLTQHETLAVLVTGKDHYTTTSTSCSGHGGERDCRTTTYHHWRVYTPGEEFSISQADYGYVIVGKKHVFYVTGWKDGRNIAEVLE